MPLILNVDPSHPDKPTLEKAVGILRSGGIIAYPTETFYGLGVDAENREAIEKIFLVKGRDFNNPVALIMGDEEPLTRLASQVPEYGRTLMERFWPGPLTLLFKATPAVSGVLTAGSGKIGIRISSHPVARLLSQMLGRPITATSANLSGHPECVTTSDVIDQIGERIDAVIDGGKTPGGLGSTILDVTGDAPVVLRAGAIPEEVINEAIKI
jgi:L-threonylcarbamoyladenylate synthase